MTPREDSSDEESDDEDDEEGGDSGDKEGDEETNQTTRGCVLYIRKALKPHAPGVFHETKKKETT